MTSYKTLEKAVFEHLNAKYLLDSKFTFSVRQSASKGAEADYFIGTEKSGYFGFTLWFIPVYYPGSSTDLLNFIIMLKNGKASLKFQFYTTRNPHDSQNEIDLEFGKSLRKKFEESNLSGYNLSSNNPSHKMEYYDVKPTNNVFSDFPSLLSALDKIISFVSPLVDAEIANIKSVHPDWQAEKWTEPKFNQLIKKLEERQAKHRKPLQIETPLIKTETQEVPLKDSNTMMPLNQILFGPPGTGKTYHTINKALEIINEAPEKALNWNDRKTVKAQFDERLKEGRIVFTTFHQSMSYEDFIEGIKPIEPKEEGGQIIYQVVDGIFKDLSKKADKRKGNFLTIIEEFKKEISEDDGKSPITIKTSGTTFDVKYKGGTAFYIRPHSSKNEGIWYPVSIANIETYFNTDSTKGLYNVTYVKGILDFLIKNKQLKKGEKTSGEPYVLIIDEINRGNVSQIFGELITLIEEDKRLGKDEALEVTLPYSKEKFGVPPNLYIIGTMNTADRSVEALDTALRRRFSFVEMPPQPELLSTTKMFRYLWEKHGSGPLDEEKWAVDEKAFFELFDGKLVISQPEYEKLDDYSWEEWEQRINSGKYVEFKGISLQTMLENINRRIEKLLDKDHLIGHSFFMKVFTIQDLMSTFYDKIIPLLQEYFYGDYGKLGLVLGKGFVREKSVGKDVKEIFCDFGEYDTSDFNEKKVYEIVDYRPEGFAKYALKPIYNGTPLTFEMAINLLMRQPIKSNQDPSQKGDPEGVEGE